MILMCNSNAFFTKRELVDIFIKDISKKRFKLPGYGGGFAQAVFGPSFSGIACRSLYAITGGFILAHTMHDCGQCFNEDKLSGKKMGISAVDTFAYESLASGLVPPLLANAVRNCVVKNYGPKYGRFKAISASLVTVVSLLAMSRPVDIFVDEILMDGIIRRHY